MRKIIKRFSALLLVIIMVGSNYTYVHAGAAGIAVSGGDALRIFGDLGSTYLGIKGAYAFSGDFKDAVDRETKIAEIYVKTNWQEYGNFEKTISERKFVFHDGTEINLSDSTADTELAKEIALREVNNAMQANGELVISGKLQMMLDACADELINRNFFTDHEFEYYEGERVDIYRGVNTYQIVNDFLARNNSRAQEKFNELVSGYTKEELSQFNLIWFRFAGLENFKLWKPMGMEKYDTWEIVARKDKVDPGKTNLWVTPFLGSLELKNSSHEFLVEGYLKEGFGYSYVVRLDNKVKDWLYQLSEIKPRVYINDGRKLTVYQVPDIKYKALNNAIDLPIDDAGNIIYKTPNADAFNQAAQGTNQDEWLEYLSKLFTGTGAIAVPGEIVETTAAVIEDTTAAAIEGTTAAAIEGTTAATGEGTLTDGLTLKSIISFWTLDIAEITAAFDGFKDAWYNKFEPIFKIGNMFTSLSAGGDENPPIIKFTVPPTLYGVVGGSEVIVFDLRPYTEHITTIRTIIKCMIWVSFGFGVLKMFDVDFHVG